MNQTWPFKDIDARPKKGRFFPASFAEVSRAVRKWKFIDNEGKRVRICFVNPEPDDSNQFLFVEYKPENALILYSWVDEVPLPVARLALAKALPVLAPLKRIWVPNGRNNFAGSYLIRFQKDGGIKLTECRLHFQQGKYCGSQKFSTAFKKRVVRVEEKALPIAASVEPDFDLVADKPLPS